MFPLWKSDYLLVQVENENKRTIPLTVEESSEDEGDDPFIVDEDMEVSPSLPPTEFCEPDNITSFGGAEDDKDSLRLKRRPYLTEDGRIVYCMIPKSPSNSANHGMVRCRLPPNSKKIAFSWRHKLMGSYITWRAWLGWCPHLLGCRPFWCSILRISVYYQSRGWWARSCFTLGSLCHS